MHFLAHDGHTHEEIATNDWWQQVLPFAYALLPLVLFWLIATYFFTAKASTKVIVVMVYLLAVGLGSFTVAPAVAIACLSAGLGLTLASTIISIKR